MLKETNTPTRPRIEPGSLDPESDALTIRPVRPPRNNVAVEKARLEVEKARLEINKLIFFAITYNTRNRSIFIKMLKYYQDFKQIRH